MFVTQGLKIRHSSAISWTRQAAVGRDCATTPISITEMPLAHSTA